MNINSNIKDRYDAFKSILDNLKDIGKDSPFAKHLMAAIQSYDPNDQAATQAAWANMYGYVGDYPAVTTEELLPRGQVNKDAEAPYTNQGELWKKEGKCPQCGELGGFLNFYPTCSKHGAY